MSLLDRLSGNTPDPSDRQPGNGHDPDPGPPESIARSVSPIVPGRPGRPSFSLDALRERIEAQFQAETAQRPDILLELDSEDKRHALLGEVIDYVLAVEAITLAQGDRAKLQRESYKRLFTLGPIEPYLNDEAVTEIAINSPRAIHVRRGLARLAPVEAAFDDGLHLANVLGRVVASAGAVLNENEPFMELGVTLNERPARLSIVGPPLQPDYTLGIRLHPRQPLELDALHDPLGMLPPQAVQLLRAIIAGGHGLLIVGDVASGKTTLLGALARLLPDDAPIVAVERATELVLPDHATRMPVTYPTPATPGQDMDARILQGLERAPDWLLIDEIRRDESRGIWAALSAQKGPRCLWVFRGDPLPARLRSALSMVIRKSQQTLDQAAINRAWAERLPFLVTLKAVGDGARLHQIAEARLNGDDLDFAPLLTRSGDTWALSDPRPQQPLDLPENFWNA